MFSIIVIHEVGHLIAAFYYKYNIEKIHLYPFGGHIKFNEKINKPIKEELIILISGPIVQIIYFLIMSTFNYFSLINANTYNLIINYHYTLLFFNLLPIFPLDGSKLLNLLLSKFISFKKAHLTMIYTSYIVIIACLLSLKHISFGINIYLLLVLLLIKIISENKNHKMLYNRFLLERYLYDFYFKTIKIIKGSKLSKMMRDKRHLFIINNKKITEKEVLKRRYKSK